MKKLLYFFMFLFMSISLFACEKNTPESTCQTLFKEVITAQGNRISVYNSDKKLITSGTYVGDINTTFKEKIKNYDFKILKTDIDDDTAEVTVLVNGVNFGNLNNDYILKILTDNKDENIMDKLKEEEYVKKVENTYLDMLKSSEVEERTIKIECIKNKSVWIIKDVSGTLDNIFGVNLPT